LQDAGIILQVTDIKQYNRILERAEKITKKYHGDSIGMIAPLYFSNLCWNDCACCDMSCKNFNLKRNTLTFEDFLEEFNLLKEIGYKTIEIVA
jgi:2-iminoacetate synthase